MRLLIDTVPVGSPGGFQLQQELARSAASCRPPDWDAALLVASDAGDIGDTGGLKVTTAERPRGWRQLRRWASDDLPRLAGEHGADVAYCLGGLLSKTLHRRCGTVYSINNMLPFTPQPLEDLPLLSKDRLRLFLLRHIYVRSSRLADTLVFPSRHGQETASSFAGDLAGKSYVAPNPVPDYALLDPGNVPEHPYRGAPYFFYLSVVRPYKNHLGLIEGYRRALGRSADLPDLILAGPPVNERYAARIVAAIERHSLGEKVKYLGKVPRAQIPAWLHHATANVFPSTCETSSFIQAEIFGARGVMACSDCPPMPEVAGGAAELFDPLDPDSISRALIRLSEDEGRRNELRRLSIERIGELSPEACGRVMWEAVLKAWDRFRSRRSR